MSDPIRRALISVHDKSGLVSFARALVDRGVEILSSGGTASALAAAGLPVISVGQWTGSPEMLSGRVKTLHPRIHGGILALRDDPSHVADLEREKIGTIDLVVVNLYPFENTVADPAASLAAAVEMIDVGGPAMIRAAAKNFAHVTIVVDPGDYDSLLEAIGASGAVPDEMRQRLSVKAFGRTAAYDRAVADELERRFSSAASPRFPERLRIEFARAFDLRYGENPHQKSAFYVDDRFFGPSIGRARQWHGKELSYNNILDLDAALALVLDLPSPACVIVKHGNPCGAAVGAHALSSFERALACDPLSAFGGVIAFNVAVDGAVARALTEQFYEAVIAPEISEDARVTLAEKKNLRVLELTDAASKPSAAIDLRSVAGGLLVQDADRIDEAVREGRVPTQRAPTSDEWSALEFAWIVARHVKSNAIVYARDGQTVGIGAGQMSRVDAADLGARKARSPIAGCVLASDAFFPFRDGVDVAAHAGVTAIVQPGGSVRDAEVVAAADEHGLAMVFTGRRHFRH